MNLILTLNLVQNRRKIVRWFALSASPTTLNFSATDTLTASPNHLDFTTKGA